MTMVSNVYKSEGKTDHQVANALVTWIHRSIKRIWWDNTITEENRTWLKKAYKRDVNNRVIKNEGGQPIEDAVNLLIFAITKHFLEHLQQQI